MIKNNIKIVSIEIKNFRSIRNSKIDVDNLNIFVGLNDAGKSNYLKALNLFFNDETDYGKEFDPKIDFSNYYQEKSKKAKKVEITIVFEFGVMYESGNKFCWKKTWDIDGVRTEKTYPYGKENDLLPKRARIDAALNNIVYRYIPAVKSQKIYSDLLKELYYAVMNSSMKGMKKTISNFAIELAKTTENVSKQILENLKIESKISTPHDPSDLFTSLIIDTKVNNKNFNIPLTYRGDGIQVIHIPYILEYIDDVENTSARRGKPRRSIIWGFEEPENGLELIKSSELANKFEEFANNIQLFITTHSPVFYIKKDIDNAKLNYVMHDENGTKINDNDTNMSKTMGLLNFISPIIKSEIKNYTDGMFPTDVDCILVEGKTDEEYLKLAIKLFSKKLDEKINNKDIIIYSSKSDGGVNNVCGYARARVGIDKSHKTLVLFDKDKAGIKCKDELENDSIIKNCSKMIKVSFIEPDESIIEYFKNDIEIEFSIEHLLSDNFWELLHRSGKLKINEDNKKFLSNDKINNDKTKSYKEIEEELFCKYKKLFYMIDDEKDKAKQKIFNMVNEMDNTEQEKCLFGLKKTIEKIEKYFEK